MSDTTATPDINPKTIKIEAGIVALQADKGRSVHEQQAMIDARRAQEENQNHFTPANFRERCVNMVKGIWKHNLARNMHISRDFKLNLALQEKLDLPSGIPLEVRDLAFETAKKRVAQRREQLNLAQRASMKMTDALDALTVNFREVDQEVFTIFGEWKNQLDSLSSKRTTPEQKADILRHNPLSPLRQAWWATSDEVAKNITDDVIGNDALHDNEFRKTGLKVAADSDLGKLLRQTVIQPFLTAELQATSEADSVANEARTRDILNQVLGSDQFATYLDAAQAKGELTAAERAELTSHDYGTNLIDVLRNGALAEARKAVESGKGLEALDFEIQLTLGAAEIGPKNNLEANWTEARVAKNKKIAEILRKRGTNPGEKLVNNNTLRRATVLERMFRTGVKTTPDNELPGHGYSVLQDALRNEMIYAAGVSVPIFMANRALTGFARAAIPIVGGSAIGGVLAWRKEGATIEDHRRLVDIESALNISAPTEYKVTKRGWFGRSVHEVTVKTRRGEIDAIAFKKRDMNDIITRLADYGRKDGTADPSKALDALATVIDWRARNRVADQEHVNMFSATDPNLFEQQRRQMDAAAAISITKLREVFASHRDLFNDIEGNPPAFDFDQLLQQLTDMHTSALSTGAINDTARYGHALRDMKLESSEQSIAKREEVFQKYKRREQTKKASKAMIYGATFGLAASEVVHAIRDLNADGVYNGVGPLSTLIRKGLHAGGVLKYNDADVLAAIRSGQITNYDMVDRTIFTDAGTPSPLKPGTIPFAGSYLVSSENIDVVTHGDGTYTIGITSDAGHLTPDRVTIRPIITANGLDTASQDALTKLGITIEHPKVPVPGSTIAHDLAIGPDMANDTINVPQEIQWEGGSNPSDPRDLVMLIPDGKGNFVKNTLLDNVPFRNGVPIDTDIVLNGLRIHAAAPNAPFTLIEGAAGGIRNMVEVTTPIPNLNTGLALLPDTMHLVHQPDGSYHLAFVGTPPSGLPATIATDIHFDASGKLTTDLVKLEHTINTAVAPARLHVDITQASSTSSGLAGGDFDLRVGDMGAEKGIKGPWGFIDDAYKGESYMNSKSNLAKNLFRGWNENWMPDQNHITGYTGRMIGDHIDYTQMGPNVTFQHVPESLFKEPGLDKLGTLMQETYTDWTNGVKPEDMDQMHRLAFEIGMVGRVATKDEINLFLNFAGGDNKPTTLFNFTENGGPSIAFKPGATIDAGLVFHHNIVTETGGTGPEEHIPPFMPLPLYRGTALNKSSSLPNLRNQYGAEAFKPGMRLPNVIRYGATSSNATSKPFGPTSYSSEPFGESESAKKALETLNHSINSSTNLYIVLGGGPIGDAVVSTAYVRAIQQALNYLGKNPHITLIVNETHGNIFQGLTSSNLTIQKVKPGEGGKTAYDIATESGQTSTILDFEQYAGNPSVDSREASGNQITTATNLLRAAIELYNQKIDSNTRYARFIEDLLSLPPNTLDSHQAIPLVKLPDDQENTFDNLASKFGIDKTKQQIAILIEASSPSKRYKPDNWIEVVSKIADEYPDYQFNFICNPSSKLPGYTTTDIESLLNKRGLSKNGRVVYGDIDEMTVFLAHQKLVLTNDTGLGHIAGAVEKGPPVLTVFLPKGPPPSFWLSSPRQHAAVLAEDEQEKLPNVDINVTDEKIKLINKIKPQDVARKALEILKL